jgi:hypothetical protein
VVQMVNSGDAETDAISELMAIAQVYMNRGDLSKAQELMALAQEIMRRKANRGEAPQVDANCG